MRCVADFPYNAEQADELSLKKGDVILNVKKMTGGWWEGTHNGKRGVFPDNFVKEIPEEPEKKKEDIPEPAPAPMTPPSHEAPKRAGAGQNQSSDKPRGTGSVKSSVGDTGDSGDDTRDNSVSAIQRRLSKGLNLGRGLPADKGPPPPSGGKGAIKGKRAKVTFSYAAEQPDELSLTVGEEVEILKQEEDGWWEGRLFGKQKVGVFPSNFVDLVKEDEEDLPSSPPPVEAKPKKVMGVGFGNIFSGGPINLKSTGGGAAAAEKKAPLEKKDRAAAPLPSAPGPKPSAPVPTPAPNASAPQAARTKPTDRAKVIFSYHAENEDELSLQDGQVVTVLDKELEDAGWWRGEMNGKVGVFPDNFVQLLPPEEPTPQPPRPVKQSVPVKENGTKDIKKELAEKDVKPAVPAVKAKPVPPTPKKPETKTPIPTPPSASTADSSSEPVRRRGPDPVKGRGAMDASDELDAVPPSTVLPSLTANRTKAPPNKRPPSTFGALKKENGPTSDWSDMKPQSPEPPVSSPVFSNLTPGGTSIKYYNKKDQPAPPIAAAHVTKPVAAPSGGDNSAVMAELRELREEMRKLRENSPSEKAVTDLQKEVRSLTATVHSLKDSVSAARSHTDSVKADLNKRIADLMNEVDEEKKIRLSTQVEMERVKKLAMSNSHSSR